jgi:tRNA (guanine37-N1)-methyltransferase
VKNRLQKSFFDVPSSDESGKICKAFDIIGDIAVIKVPKTTLRKAHDITERIMTRHRNVRTVLAQTSSVSGEFRLRPLSYLRGENKTSTVHREYGCLLSVDLAKCYFSPRLSNERHRIACAVRPREIIVNMFAGVGCFSIMIAKHADPEKVYSIDLNPSAILIMKENIRLNRVYDTVVPLQGDSEEIAESKLQNVADRVLMPLPEKALEYLPIAISTLKASGGWIHYYGFEHAKKNENPIEKIRMKVAERLSSLNVVFSFPFSRVIRTTGPNWHQVVLDIYIKRFSDKS